MKKILLILLFVCLIFEGLCAQQSLGHCLEHDRKIRIGLVSMGRNNTFHLKPSSNKIEIVDAFYNQLVYRGRADNIKVFASGENKIKVLVDNKRNFSYFTGPLHFTTIGDDEPHVSIRSAARANYSDYRGTIELTFSRSTLFAINQLDVECYLKSVVPREIFTRSADATLQAQAIAARTYIFGNMQRHTRQNYNLCDQVHCQAYSGISSEYPKTSAAVETTAGMVLTFKGDVANTVYHSNCGGILMDARAVWGGAGEKYLISHFDGVSGQRTFCSIGYAIKNGRRVGQLPPKVSQLAVNQLPRNTNRRYHSSFGHRVGMCQDGAIGMGAIGYNKTEILSFYYPGTTLEKMDYILPEETSTYIITSIQQKRMSFDPLEPVKATRILRKERPLNPNSLRTALSIASNVSTKTGSKNFKKFFWSYSVPEISNNSFSVYSND